MTTADRLIEDEKHHDRHTVTVMVDNEPVAGVSKHTTPNAILALAGVDPATHYLVRVKGRHQEPFAGHGDQEITVHEGETFVSVSTGPTPTS